MSELQVIATIPAKPEAVETVRTALQTLAAATLQEDGCLSYDLFESAAVPGTFMTVERWTGQEALDGHLQSPHVADAFSAATDALAGEVVIHPLSPVR